MQTVRLVVSAWGTFGKGQPLIPTSRAGGGGGHNTRGLAGGSSHRHPFTPMRTSHLNRRRLQQERSGPPAELQEAWQLGGRITICTRRWPSSVGVGRRTGGPPALGICTIGQGCPEESEEEIKCPESDVKHLGLWAQLRLVPRALWCLGLSWSEKERLFAAGQPQLLILPAAPG